jgi:hypothetical protein
MLRRLQGTWRAFAPYQVALALVVPAWLASVSTAHAEVDGSVPGPGLCAYPMVGESGMDFGVYHYVCDGPIEINGSHWHCEYGGAAGQGSVGGGLSLAIISLNAQVGTNIGVLEGTCSWRCPDNNLAAAPNPPLAWQGGQPMTARCKDIAPAPVPMWMANPQPAPGPPNPLAPQPQLPPGPLPVPNPTPTTPRPTTADDPDLPPLNNQGPREGP